MESKIKTVFEEVLNIELDNISDLTKYEVDSLDFINIMFKLDTELNIKISNEEITKHELTKVDNFIQSYRPISCNNVKNSQVVANWSEAIILLMKVNGERLLREKELVQITPYPI